MRSVSKNMKLIIIWDQVVACRKMKKEKKGGDIVSSGVNSLLLLTYLVCLLSRKAGFNQEGGINQNRNRAQRTPGARKTLAANVCFAREACQRARTRTLVSLGAACGVLSSPSRKEGDITARLQRYLS